MALDGMMLRFIGNELRESVTGGKVDKIYQPSREMLVFVIRGKNMNRRLLISAAANSARIHFTSKAVENPAEPPMFCMLLRKRLCGAKILEIEQLELERVLTIKFSAYNELGDNVLLTLAVEIMGRHSNVILIDERGIIVDSIKKIDSELSSKRLILPGLRYENPPPQDKLSLIETPCERVVERLKSFDGKKLDKALINAVQGISPIVAREISFESTGRVDPAVDELSEKDYDALRDSLEHLKQLLDGKGCPNIIKKDDKLIDFTFMEPRQYGDSIVSAVYDNYSDMLDDYYFRQDLTERMRTKSQDLLKLLSNASSRISKKLDLQRLELEKCANRDELKLMGDLIISNIHLLKKGDVSVEVTNYFSDDCAQVTVTLDPTLTPSQNAQKYYKEYRKAQIAEEHLVELIKKGAAELEYIDSVLDTLSRAETVAELEEIREELTSEGLLKPKKGKSGGKGTKKRQSPLAPLKFVSDDGYTILVGRNNRQNDILTLKESRNNDIWLHTLKIHGAHVVILTENSAPPDRTIEQAAQIAAYHSSARDAGVVSVDYTLIKYVNKPRGAKPGMVIYTHQNTIFVRPDETLVHRLERK